MNLDGSTLRRRPLLAALSARRIRGRRPTAGGRCKAGFRCFMMEHLPAMFLAVTSQKRPPAGAVGRCTARYVLESGQGSFGTIWLRRRLSHFKLLALLAALMVQGGMATAGCRNLTHLAHSYTVCEATAGKDDLRLFLNAGDGSALGSFERAAASVAPATLGIAMNAGMYHRDRRPVGLYLEAGREVSALVTSDGPGNFGLLPNGVFCIGPDRFSVVESRAYALSPPDCRFATQSGPMLVIDGGLHPRFLPKSASRHIRNGVGVSADGKTAYFAIANQPVNFTEFAGLFRDALGVPDALYFDGSISRLHAPDLGRTDFGLAMGPMVGTVVGP